MKKIIIVFIASIFFSGVILPGNAQTAIDSLLSGLEFRSLGPALTSGRIADIALHPENENIWYVAVGSGGVWKTVNAGTTWNPIFDDQASYSIGCITIDPTNPHTIWVGTGENVGGRHVGFGDGVYKSLDDGKTWKNMGLKTSEHISKIVVHPTNPNIIWVAAQGPLWNKGGERGVYKSIDGGTTWKKTLGDDEWTGATDLIINYENPDMLYAATWQRHRSVALYLGGGPGSAIYKSTNGGETWDKLTEGIPTSNLGKIGLSISPFKSDVIYAAIELDRKKGGIFMSENGGMSWVKQSDEVSGGTGPHYYQELYASPHQEGRLYLMSYIVKISDDHGKTFESMNEEKKHVDSHAMAFKKDDPNYILVGTDGGLYETYDLTKSWKQIQNLPVTQYYKVAVDDSEPFYNIYGGTQDNGSHGGPSQTRSVAGIQNRDWWITLGADGHQSAVEPGNPNITYGEFQEGWLWRIDQTTGEKVFIQPQPKEGEPYERFNWDAPILVSPHNPTRIYYASQRVWRSDNRGDDWTPISGDLTQNQDRITFPMMGKQQSWDNPWDVDAMSNYNTITSLAESPLEDGLIYAGTDDGFIQITINGGDSWEKVALGSIKGIPSTVFVNDIKADLFDANTVYAALDNHKFGDFKPYLIKSTNKGKSWSSINGDLPDRLLTWRLVQDHVKKDLLFAATEFGIFVTTNGGSSWIELKGGLPTISFRDLTIQRRENDLVCASFGRGFYILDDIASLREIDESTLKLETKLFKVKTANVFVQTEAIYGQGDAEYVAKNPPYGAVFTYFLSDNFKSKKEARQELEKKLSKENKSIPVIQWSEIEEETRQQPPEVLLTIRDSKGNVVNTIKGTNKKGFNRVNWKLDFAERSGEKLEIQVREDMDLPQGFIATPGAYSVEITKRIDGNVSLLAGPEQFEVVPLSKGALEGASPEEIEQFRLLFEDFQQSLSASGMELSKSLKRIDAMQRALDKSVHPNYELSAKIYKTREALLDIEKNLSGDKTKREIGEKYNPTPQDVNYFAYVALVSSTYGPTGTQKAALARAKNQLDQINIQLLEITEKVLPEIEEELKSTGAPWIEGQGIRKD